ncbi:CubicO group peptidase (beta-lactamase class C family) [Actinoplanes octamycinicus]|uniref:CubicO group peptidase (Beta-lactamase class C family) n=1 Tax=Actinoplanes octamycinicus TaxID=135948 RepID=A0A7W7GZB2_9ACTN|nr:serine hydrolase domain-containing protein [Actinoplanes octamycinicus]MBB4740887.1 CubicO group peptidase (beta-lactamase class C family) [Actinoplanes octamycinicus]GIE55794.1 hypothetical protein Aoc01nite_11960 [Actinoplanes octamycinicus]
MSDLAGLTEEAVAALTPKRPCVVVAAIAGDEVVVRGSAGVDGTTRFEIGSVTKVFTALTLASRVQAGALTLDQPLGDLLPVPDGCRITLRQLATHTSGLPRLPPGMLLDALLHPGKRDPYAHCSADFLLGALGRTRRRAPGKVRYSNFGAGLLGLALTRHAGLDFDGLVTAELGSPLSLTGTATAGPAVQGHRRNGRPAAPWHLNALAGAGGLRSTADDLVRFVRAHLGESPLSGTVRLALSVEERANPFLTVHLGWMSRRLKDDRRQYFHNGGTGGFTSFVGFDPAAGAGVVALSATARSVDGPAVKLLTALGAAG